MRKWSKESIAEEIRRLHEAGENLNYGSVVLENVALLRAATRYFSGWRAAVEFSGLNYDEIRRYRTWTKKGILEHIQGLHTEGVDLSWRNVSVHVAPQLAAAATKQKHFGSWGQAIAAAGLDYGRIRRYRDWDEEGIKVCLQELHREGVDLNAKSMEQRDIALITAARRRFESWDAALTAAGLDYSQIALRASSKRRRKGNDTERS